MTHRDETAAVRERYERRKELLPPDRYSILAPDVWQTVHERQRVLIDLFRNRLQWTDLAARHLVEVGCGGGMNLLELVRLGFAPENLEGIELLEDRAAAARARLPASIAIRIGDAVKAPIPPDSQDIVYQSVVFSSLLDDLFQERLAAAMWRWVRPGGGVLWYDFTFDNPRNRDVRGVPVRRIRELFPAGQLAVRRVTLAPPIARRAAAMHPALYRILNVLPFLRTHVLCWIQKP